MAAGFQRRYGFFPALSTLTAIEGVVIIDTPPPSTIAGLGTGVVAMVGEFPDLTLAVNIANGLVSPNPVATLVTSSKDLLSKTGNFDALLGDIAGYGGNGFISLRNKQFSTLVVVPVNILTNGSNPTNNAVRIYRLLPGSANATGGLQNTQAIVPVTGYSVGAPTQFNDTSNHRVYSAAGVGFTALGAYGTAVDGEAASGSSNAATQAFLAGLPISTAALVRAANVVTGTVSSTTSLGAIGTVETAFIAPTGVADANFPAGAKTITVTGATTFTYPETGSAVSSADPYQVSLENFSAIGPGALSVQVGDILVIGSTVGFYQNASNGLLAGSGTTAASGVAQLRVTAVPTANQLTVEAMNGANFAWNTGGFSAQPWRIHHASDADTGTTGSGTASGYTVPARALDATITSSASAPTGLAPAVSVSSTQDATWLPSNGLTMLVQKGSTVGPIYIANLTAPNVVGNADMDAAYATAIASLNAALPPASTVNIAFCSRQSGAIHKSLQTWVDGASAVGIGRTCCIAPPLSVGGVTVTETQVLGPLSGFVDSWSSLPEAVAYIRDERVNYSWPGVQTYVPEAAGLNLKGSDGTIVTSGVLDIAADGWLASVLSNINPENNPGQALAPVPQVMAGVAGYQRGIPAPALGDYIAFKQNGICAPRLDQVVGPIFQSGITTSLVSGQTNINRRRMADFIEDSVAAALAPMSKAPLTIQLQDTMTSETTAFCEQLLSSNNPAAQRIQAYSVDDKSGNTQTQEAQGVFVIITNVQMLPTADVIVAQFNVGPNVVVIAGRSVS